MKRDTPRSHPTLVPGLLLSKSDVSPLLKHFCGCLMRINLYWLPRVHCSSPQQASDCGVTTWRSPESTHRVPRLLRPVSRHAGNCHKVQAELLNPSQNFQVLNKQSSKALRSLRHTVWLLQRTLGQSGSQDRAQSEAQASGNSPGSTVPDHLGSGLCHCRAGRQEAGVARVAPANSVASWQQRPSQRSRYQDQAQAGQLQASPRAPTAECDPEGARSWPGATASLPARHFSTSAHLLRPQPAHRRSSRDQAGSSKQGKQAAVRDPRARSGVRRSPEQAAHGGGSCKTSQAKCCQVALLPDPDLLI